MSEVRTLLVYNVGQDEQHFSSHPMSQLSDVEVAYWLDAPAPEGMQVAKFEKKVDGFFIRFDSAANANNYGQILADKGWKVQWARSDYFLKDEVVGQMYDISNLKLVLRQMSKETVQSGLTHPALMENAILNAGTWGSIIYPRKGGTHHSVFIDFDTPAAAQERFCIPAEHPRASQRIHTAHPSQSIPGRHLRPAYHSIYIYILIFLSYMCDCVSAGCVRHAVRDGPVPSHRQPNRRGVREGEAGQALVIG